MKHATLGLLSLACLAAAGLQAQDASGNVHFSTRFVTVEKDVKLEVVDYGGSGRPLILLAGLGGTAHDFDGFAPKLTARHHVYAVTRRGFEPSSIPPAGYSSDRLGDDLLEVMDQMAIIHPVLVGHSIAGEELSSVGSRHPEKVAGLVYLEAANSYAFYNPSAGDLLIDSIDLRNKINQLLRREYSDESAMVAELAQALPRYERDLKAKQAELPPAAPADAAALPPAEPGALTPAQAIFFGAQKYTSVDVPVLALFAYPHAFMGMYQDDPAGRARAEAIDVTHVDLQAKAVAKASPGAHIVYLPHAQHLIYASNEAEVLHEMAAFLDNLPGN